MLERFAIAFLVGMFGFLIGMFVWWEFSGIPGSSLRLFFPMSLALGVICFFLGLWRPNATIDVLGLIGQKIWSLAFEVLRWFRWLLP